MACGVKRLHSDEYNEATKEMFECLKLAAQYPIGHHRREYWNNKAKEIEKYREELKAAGKDRYVG